MGRRWISRVAERLTGVAVDLALDMIARQLRKVAARPKPQTDPRLAADPAEVQRLNKEWARVAQEAHRIGRAELLDELAFMLGAKGPDEALQRLAERLDELQRLRIQGGALARVTDLPGEGG